MFSTLEAAYNSPKAAIPLEKYLGSVGQVEPALDGLLGVIRWRGWHIGENEN
jgi:hypothetical protein